jgi:hypothetical protein
MGMELDDDGNLKGPIGWLSEQQRIVSYASVSGATYPASHKVYPQDAFDDETGNPIPGKVENYKVHIEIKVSERLLVRTVYYTGLDAPDAIPTPEGRGWWVEASIAITGRGPFTQALTKRMTAAGAIKRAEALRPSVDGLDIPAAAPADAQLTAAIEGLAIHLQSGQKWAVARRESARARQGKL